MDHHIKLILENAGWYPGRKIDISYMIEELRARRIALPTPQLERFLEEYWNIQLEFQTPDSTYNSIRLNIEVGSELTAAKLQPYESGLNEKLTPVGSTHYGSGLLLAANSGKYYLAINRQIYQIGTDFFDMLENLVYQKDVPLVWE